MGGTSSTDKPNMSASASLSSPDHAPTRPPAEEKEAEARQGEGEEEGGEEQGECGFCLFMKAGGCRDAFIAWENCIDQAEKGKEDIVEKCFEVTSNLRKCMEAHAEYYEPILRAEKRAEEEAAKELSERDPKPDKEEEKAEVVVEAEPASTGVN